MSESRPGDRPRVYRMPQGAFRVGEAPAAPAPEAPQRPPVPQAPPVATRRRRVGDVVACVLLLVIGAALAAGGSVLSLFLAFASDRCGAASCSYDQMNLGIWVAMTAPWALWLIALVVTSVLIAARRLSFWLPLALLPLQAVAWLFGAWLVGSAIR